MSHETLRARLAREAREYLADLRHLRDDLRMAEGWIAFGLLIIAFLILVAWSIVSLGYNPPNDQIQSVLYKLGLRSCRPPDNFSGVVIFIDLFLLLFLTVISIGNVFNLMKRVREGRPREPRDLIISSSLMILAGIGGIFFMLRAC